MPSSHRDNFSCKMKKTSGFVMIITRSKMCIEHKKVIRVISSSKIRINVNALTLLSSRISSKRLYIHPDYNFIFISDKNLFKYNATIFKITICVLHGVE